MWKPSLNFENEMLDTTFGCLLDKAESLAASLFDLDDDDLSDCVEVNKEKLMNKLENKKNFDSRFG